MENYKGLFIQKLSNGEIFSVQVQDTHGHDIAINTLDYIIRGIKPDIKLLPDERTYSKSDSTK